jgi:hypothetical protein
MNYQFKCSEIEIKIVNIYDVRKYYIVPNVSWGADLHECDMLIIDKNGNATEIEIKISKSDLKADLLKTHHHKSDKIKNLYYAIPNWMYEDALKILPENVGIYTVTKTKYGSNIYKERKCIPNKYAKPLSHDEIFNILRLGVMRVWRLKAKLQKYETKKKITYEKEQLQLNLKS